MTARSRDTSGRPERVHADTRVPITSLCPCSREISDYGAHNQRGTIEINVSFDLIADGEHVDFSDLVEVAERPVRRRSTPSSSEPMSVHHDAGLREPGVRRGHHPRGRGCPEQRPRIRSGRVRVVNEESIHSHNAYAAVAWTR